MFGVFTDSVDLELKQALADLVDLAKHKTCVSDSK